MKALYNLSHTPDQGETKSNENVLRRDKKKKKKTRGTQRHKEENNMSKAILMRT
jgi:hypothetical protein